MIKDMTNKIQSVLFGVMLLNVLLCIVSFLRVDVNMMLMSYVTALISTVIFVLTNILSNLLINRKR